VDVKTPHDVEAEQGVLGGILGLGDFIHPARKHVKPGDFFIVRNEWVFEAMCALADRREAIDYLTVTSELRSMGKLDELGGMLYLTELLNHTPAFALVEDYAKTVSRKALRRRMLTAASDIAKEAHDESKDEDTVIANAERTLFTATEQRGNKRARCLVQSMPETVRSIEERIKKAAQGKTCGVPSGQRDVDAKLGGFEPEWFMILAGRPGMGKTSELLTIARNAARRGVRVGLFSMEMTEEEINQRLLAMETGISTERMRKGDVSDDELKLIVTAAGALGVLPVFIDDSKYQTPATIRAQALRWQHEHGLDLVLIDYIGLMHSVKDYRGNKVLEVSEISRALKLLPGELRAPVLAAAQLNRELEKRKDKRPLLSDLRDSGTLEQDADVVMFLYRDWMYNTSSSPKLAELNIAKNRHGKTGMVELEFRADVTEFADYNPVVINLERYDAPDYAAIAKREQHTANAAAGLADVGKERGG
jgi:replicative DNA helicase